MLVNESSLQLYQGDGDVEVERNKNQIKPKKPNNFPYPPTGNINYIFSNSSQKHWSERVVSKFFSFLFRQTEYTLDCSVSI